MSFLAPYWLLAASAILVPVAIHLWNKRQGKTVKVGSLRWLEPSASRRWSSIKLSDVWLLVLRCLILLLLATALAKPVWEGNSAAKQARKAVFISPELLHSTALSQLAPTIDALLQRGYTLHHYTPDFAAIPAEQWQNLRTSPADSVVGNGNHWGLLPALAHLFDQPEDSVWLFTSDEQRHFAGIPSAVQENIRWVPVALTRETNWIQAAYNLGTDSLLLVTGQSNRQGTRYSALRVSRNRPTAGIQGQQVQLRLQQDSLFAQWPDAGQQGVKVQQKPLVLGIAHNEAQAREVRYLQAAAQAISNYTGIPIKTRVLPDTSTQPDTAANWLFWLSSEKVPGFWLEQVQEKGVNLWLQPELEPVATSSQVAAAGIEKIRIHQLTKTGIASSYAGLKTLNVPFAEPNAIWQTSHGEMLLTAQQLGLGKVYHFRSGFGPAWSQLGQRAQLPELLLPLLLPQPSVSHFDARALDETQLKPSTWVQPVSKKSQQETQQYSLVPWLGLLAFLLFLAERIITRNRKTA